MKRLILLHTNDIHGRVEGLARLATLVEQVRRANPDAEVLYVDAGDIEETTSRLSNLTKGAAMHRLLSAAGCAVATVGNAALVRYGGEILDDQAHAASYPLLLANVRPRGGELFPGVHASAQLDVDGFKLGVVGVSSPMTMGRPVSMYSQYFEYDIVPTLPLVHDLVADLRRDGADAVLLLSHLGLRRDRELAAELGPDVPIVIGGHTHDLLPEGERVGGVVLAHAGEYAEHLGRVDLRLDDSGLQIESIRVLPVPETIEPHAGVLAELGAIERDIEAFLGEVIGELAEPLDLAYDRECGAANWMADILRKRMAAEVAVAAAGQVFTGPFAAGPLTRGALWEVCHSSANPGVTTMTGAQLLALVARGLDPALAADTTSRPLRGQPRGLLHLSGAEVRDGRLLVGGAPVDVSRAYRVAGSDFELEGYGGYVDPGWELELDYHVPTILREAVEEHLVDSGPVQPPSRRLHGRLFV